MDLIKQTINKIGWAMVASTSKYGVDYVYTVGLNKFNHPDLIVVGPNFIVGEEILLCISNKIIVDGETFKNESCYEIFKFYDVDNKYKYEHMAQCLDHYEGDFEAIQVLWPDDGGKYPTDPKFNRRIQYMLKDLFDPTLN